MRLKGLIYNWLELSIGEASPTFHVFGIIPVTFVSVSFPSLAPQMLCLYIFKHRTSRSAKEYFGNECASNKTSADACCGWLELAVHGPLGSFYCVFGFVLGCAA